MALRTTIFGVEFTVILTNSFILLAEPTLVPPNFKIKNIFYKIIIER